MEAAESAHQRLATEFDRVEASNAFAILGVSSGASSREIRAAYITAAKAFHPHRFGRYERTITRLATEIFIRINSAYKALAATGLVAEEPPDIQLPPVEEPPVEPRPRVGRGTPSAKQPLAALGAKHKQAQDARFKEEELFAEALRRYDAGDFSTSYEQLRELAIAHPHVKHYRAHMHCARAGVHFGAGEHDKGDLELERALRIDAALPRAKAAVAAAAKSRKKGGLFSRLFRK